MSISCPNVSVVAHVDFYSGAIRQRMTYDAYGTMTVLQNGDYDGDGDVDQDDLAAAKNANGTPAADFNGDGSSGSADWSLFGGWWGQGLAAGAAPDEVRIGYGGYVRDPVTGLLLARNRWYEPRAGGG
jgi:hypothetical protein